MRVLQGFFGWEGATLDAMTGEALEKSVSSALSLLSEAFFLFEAFFFSFLEGSLSVSTGFPDSKQQSQAEAGELNRYISTAVYCCICD